MLAKSLKELLRRVGKYDVQFASKIRSAAALSNGGYIPQERNNEDLKNRRDQPARSRKDLHLILPILSLTVMEKITRYPGERGIRVGVCTNDAINL